MNLDKNDKHIIIIGLLISFIASLFIYKTPYIVLMLIALYFIHKYLGNIEKYDNLIKDEIVYIDKEKYYRGLKSIVLILDLCLVIGMTILLVGNNVTFVIIEIVSIFQVIKIYINSLSRKYIKSINGEEVIRKRKLGNNKILTSIVLVLFIGYTFNYFSKVTINTDCIKSDKYEYSLIYNDEGNRIIKVRIKDDYYQRAQENKDNTKYLDKYIKDSKNIIFRYIFNEYLFMFMVFMFILSLIQVNFKNRKNQSVLLDVFFIIGMLVAMILSFSINYNLDYNLSTYFHTYLSTY